MKITLTKRIVSLLAVVALLMTMFTGMVFSASAEDTAVETTTDLLPTADASKWTGNVEYILGSDLVLNDVTCAKAGSFVIRDNTNEPKKITTVDTFNLGDNFKVSGTLAGTKFRRSDDFYAYAYAQVGDFKFVIGDERDETDANRPKVMYVRAYMGEELVYEERIMQGNTLGLNIFDQVNFNATIDNNAKTVTLDYTKGAIGELETINGTGTYTGDYSFDAVTATAAAQNNFVATDDAVNVAVAGLSLTKYRVVQGGDTSSDDTSSDATSSGEVVETTTNLLPTADATKWTGATEFIAANDVVLNGNTYANAGSLVVNANTDSIKEITTIDTFDFGNQLKVSGTLVLHQYHSSTPAIVYAKVGNFKFEIESSSNTLYARAYMGEEVVHEKTWTSSDQYYWTLFQQVRFNATIDTESKTVTLDYTTGPINRLTTNEIGSVTYTGDYSFDGVTATASAKNNWMRDDNVAGGTVNVAVAGLSVTYYEIVQNSPVDFTLVSDNENYGTVTRSPSGSIYQGDSVTITASAADGYEFAKWVDQNGVVYDNLTATATVIAGATNYYKAIFQEKIESDYLVETTVDLLPDTDISKWTGDTGYISASDVELKGNIYAPSGSLVVNENSASVRQVTSADIYDFGNKFKVSGVLVLYQYHSSTPAIVYARVGDFRFEIESNTNILYARAYMGEEVVYEKTWTKSDAGYWTLFQQVRFNATIDNNAKTVTLDYTTGPINRLTNNYASATYTGDYSFDDVTVTASAKNNWMRDDNVDGGTVNVAVAGFSVTKYEIITDPVTFTVVSDNESYGTVTRTPAGDVYVGDQVTITAQANDGYVFKGWVDQNNKPYTNLGQTAFVKAGKTNYYKALFVTTEVAVTIIVNAQNGRVYTYHSANYPTIEGMLLEDETIRRAITGVPGYSLTGWVDEEGNEVSATTVHTSNITITPVYGLVTKTCKITIDGQTTEYAFNTAVLATSQIENFSYWSEDEEPVTFANPYRFFAVCDRTIISVSDSSFQIKPLIKINNMWNENGYDYVLTEWAIPSTCTFVAEGVMMTKDPLVNLADKTLVDVDNNTIRVATTKYDYSVGQYMIYTYQNSKLKVKAFLTYRDAQGVEKTIYTQVRRSTADYYATDNWQPVDIVSAELKGQASEGCQWTTNVVFAPDDENLPENQRGKVAYLCLDTSGPYKTVDGGETWKPSSLGWAAGGCQSLAIDPYNANHIVGAGNSSVTNAEVVGANGVYLSLNGGQTWKRTLDHCIGSPRTSLNQFVFDPTSYNESTDMCMTVYWSSEDNDRNTLDNDPQLFKSTDGGVNWTPINENFGGCHLEIANDGTLFAAKYPCYLGTDTLYDMGTTTIYKSTNGGANFTALNNISNVRTFDVQNDVLYVSTTTGFYKSTDKGTSFTKVNTNADYKDYTQLLAVSPDGQNMVMQLGSGDGYFREKYYSANGGVTWTAKNIYNDIVESSFMPVNPRVSVASYSPVYSNLVISNYGDTVIRSVDGGATWTNSNLGYNTINTEQINFNVYNQNLMIVPSQDYNGAYSTDGGQTFKYINWSGKGWGGFTYGGYIFDENTMFVINSDSWWSSGTTEKYVYTTFDGGETINRNRTDAFKLAADADQASLGSVRNNNIAFVGNLRTTNRGQSFSPMNQVYNKDKSLVNGAYVLGVWCVDYETGRLYGRDNKGFAVYSDNDGVEWYQFADLTSSRYSGQLKKVLGISCDINGYVYFYTTETYGGYVEIQKTTVTEGKLSQMIDIVSPIDSNKKWNGALTVDYYTGTLYLGAGSETQPKDANIPCMWRSEDGGKTWVELSVHLDQNLEKVGNPITEVYPTGDVTHIAINYQTNEVFAVFLNHGIWKIGRAY